METAARSQNGDVPPLLQAIASLYSSVYFVVFTCMHSMVDTYVCRQETHTHTVTGTTQKHACAIKSVYILKLFSLV